MNQINVLEQLRQCFINIIPETDGRASISPLEFVINIVFCYLGDTQCTSLESIRRHLKNQTQKKLSRSAFWERISRNRLKKFLKATIVELMKQLSLCVLGNGGLLNQLGVTGVFVVDSCTFTLWNGVKENFPGVSTTAGIKWHSCFNILTGQLQWFELTPSSTSDHKCFPNLNSLKGKLVIADLGYWDFTLLFCIADIGGFFLSRLKSKSVVIVKEIIIGKISKKYIGTSLLGIPIKQKRSDILEVIVEKVCDKGTLCCRAIGFWNPVDKYSHWYVTNLKVPAILIYPLYRLRWQIELIFKACKQSLNANRLTSNDSNIIESLLLASIASHLASHTILTRIAVPELTKAKRLAVSFLRVAKVAVLLANDFINFLINGSSRHAKKLIDKIKLFSDEIFDPNYKHRDSSLARICQLLEGTL